jgi:adenine-specific DNA-methyltransferase
MAMPELFTEGDLDPQKVLTIYGQDTGAATETYGLSWRGRRAAIKTVQTASRGTLAPNTGISTRWEEASHALIAGDNLEAMKLLYRSYHKRFTLIYIDPPYNTTNDFIYADDYTDTLGAYLRFTGQVDAAGNLHSTKTDAAGRLHSRWLTMIYPRLYLAQQLLADDGAVFVSIDSREVHNLRHVMNELFGESCFVADITVVNNPKGRNLSGAIATTHEHLLCYANPGFVSKGLPLSEEDIAGFREKNAKGEPIKLLGFRKRGGADTRADRPKQFYPIYIDPRSSKVAITKTAGYSVEVFPKRKDGVDGCWRWSKKTAHDNIDLIHGQKSRAGEWRVVYEVPLNTSGGQRRKKPKSCWTGKHCSTDRATTTLKKLIPEITAKKFTPKPTGMLLDILGMSCSETSLVLDLFAGSGSLAHAVIDFNKATNAKVGYVGIQLPEPLPKAIKAREMPLRTIYDVALLRALRLCSRGSGSKQKKLPFGQTDAPGVRAFRLAASCIRPWQGVAQHSAQSLHEALAGMIDPLVDGWKEDDLIWEIILKQGLSLAAKVERRKPLHGNTFIDVTDSVTGQQLLLCLDSTIKESAIKSLSLTKDTRLIVRDSAMSDTLAANLALQCRVSVI